MAKVESRESPTEWINCWRRKWVSDSEAASAAFPSLALPLFGTQRFRFGKPTTIWKIFMLEFQIKIIGTTQVVFSIFANLTKNTVVPFACHQLPQFPVPFRQSRFGHRKRCGKWWRLIVKVVKRQAVLYNVLVPVPRNLEQLKRNAPRSWCSFLLEKWGKWFLEMIWTCIYVHVFFIQKKEDPGCI